MGTTPARDPKAGDLFWIGELASVQFARARSFWFRVIRTLDRTTYDGWVWLDGYTLDQAGNAIERREIFVQRAGLIEKGMPKVPRPAAVTVRRARAPRPSPALRPVPVTIRSDTDRGRSSRAKVR